MWKMVALDRILAKAELSPKAISISELASLIGLVDPAETARLYTAALRVKARYVGRTVSLRGLIEIDNVCAKDCYYCGIRSSNRNCTRYQLTQVEILALAKRVAMRGWASLVLQGGEISTPSHTEFVTQCLKQISALDLGVTLSLGEQTDETFRLWRQVGATRYLLRIETSSPELYAQLHPASHSWQNRVACLRTLRRCNYQVGTGVMCGLPNQTPLDLARDVFFFGEIDADMIGMGPYIPHPDTPLYAHAPRHAAAFLMTLSLNMIASVRLYLHDVNIAATTALQTLAINGRAQGLLAGANVIMPNVTDCKHGKNYTLYEGKPFGGEDSTASWQALLTELAQVGHTPILNARGDSKHWFNRQVKELKD